MAAANGHLEIIKVLFEYAEKNNKELEIDL